jgi:hypothetical protein
VSDPTSSARPSSVTDATPSPFSATLIEAVCALVEAQSAHEREPTESNAQRVTDALAALRWAKSLELATLHQRLTPDGRCPCGRC